jgi:ribonuclease R
VTSFGFFVELQSIYVEGLVHIASLRQDYFLFDAASHRLYGERTGVRYRLGDSVKIKVVRVNLDDKKIDFELLESAKKATKPAVKAKPRSKKADEPKAKTKAKPKSKKPAAKAKAKKPRKS